MAKMDEQFIQDVLNTVDLIPFGLVASYGQIAQMICRPRNANDLPAPQRAPRRQNPGEVWRPGKTSLSPGSDRKRPPGARLV